MKFLLKFFFLLLCCLFFVQVILQDSGYVYVSVGGISFESSFWGFLLLIALAYLLSVLLWLFLRMLVGGASFVYPITKTSKQARARRLTGEGFNNFINGQWKKAEKLLAKAADSGETPLVNYLAAAHSAQEIGSTKNALCYLGRAEKVAPHAKLAIGIAYAKLYLAQRKYEQALATLKVLYSKAPKHTYVLKLLKKVYLELHDWQALTKLLPILKQHKIVKNEEFSKLQVQAYDALFEYAYQKVRFLKSEEKKKKAILEIWQSVPKNQRYNDRLIQAYVFCLKRLNLDVMAEQVLLNGLRRAYSPDIVTLYGQIEGSDGNGQLLELERFLKERPNDAHLLLALGRVCLHNKFWGKAQEYFDASIQQSPTVNAYYENAKLLAYLGDYTRSSQNFKLGLELATKSSCSALLPYKIQQNR